MFIYLADDSVSHLPSEEHDHSRKVQPQIHNVPALQTKPAQAEAEKDSHSLNRHSFPDSQLSKASWKSVAHGTKLEAHLAILPRMSSLTAKSSPGWTDCPPTQRCLVHSLLLPHLPSGISDLS